MSPTAGEMERSLEEGSLSPVPVIQDIFLCLSTLTGENYIIIVVVIVVVFVVVVVIVIIIVVLLLLSLLLLSCAAGPAHGGSHCTHEECL